LRPAQPVERAVGIDHYASESDGCGGRLRASPADFRVRELEAFDAEPVDADPGPYPHLVLRVRLSNWDTNDFARRLSNAVGASRERVSWAGTKDKRAETVQLFSLDDADDEDLRAVETLSVDGATVEVVGRAGRPVLFGDLAGNDFRVVVRDADRPAAVEQVRAELAAFAASGGDPTADADTADGDGVTVAVPNWFGHQRFGSRRPVTHEVGLAIVRRDWEAAALAYVGDPHEREPERTREARAYVEETRDWAGALDRLPRALDHERAICSALAGVTDPEPADYRRALEAVPTNLQRLFVHAAQSYAFNRIVSRRLERGLPLNRPVAGDVVCFLDRDLPGDLAVPDTDRAQRVTAERVDSMRRHCERGRAYVTGPLVGTETELGEGEPGEIERAVLEDLGLAPEEFALPGAFESTGDRRALLVSTDLRVERDPLALAFALPRGSYATSVLREFLKVDPRDL
jgi:tRNA pseudouridine13 synthase